MLFRSGDVKLPTNCDIVGVMRSKQEITDLTNTVLIPADQVEIEMNADDIEKLYEPLVSMANIY